jgi:hypothetical protein
MAKQTINIGAAANDGTGDQVRVAFDKTNQNFTELYDSQLTNTDSLSQGVINLYNQTHTGEVTGSQALTIANDVITYAKLGAEFTTSAVIAASSVDFSSAQVFTKTLTADTTFTFSNASVGMVKDLIITGAFVPTFPAGSKVIAGTYNGAVSNLIQVVVAGSGDYWLSISQEQV